MAKDRQQPDTVSRPLPATATEMQKFFHIHGVFRAADVQSVLGDPSKGVTLERCDEPAFSKLTK
jgi:hypothetical protein